MAVLRITVRTDDAEMAFNVGGAVHTGYRSFDIELPNHIAEFVTKPAKGFVQRQIVSTEIVEDALAGMHSTTQMAMRAGHD